MKISISRREGSFMSREFKSIYAEPIKELISLHRALGYKFDRAMPYLHQIDDFAVSCREANAGITKEFAKIWRKKREDESDYRRYSRILYLAKLSRLLVDSGIDSVVPKLPRKPKSSFVPYVFSHEQVNKLFAASDQLRLQVFNKEANVFSFPAMFRMFYATGVRLGEARNLTDVDVNLTEGWLNIQISKNGKQRKIPIDDSLIDILKQYLTHRNLLPLAGPPETFFIRMDGKKCGSQGIRQWFKQCLKMSNVGDAGQRIHDLRHTFATHSLVKMLDTGINIYLALPALCAYLGHDTVESTSKYIRLTAQIFPRIMTDINQRLDDFRKLNPNEST